MDTTNILPLILPKMRKQMHTKGITSLDEIYMTIAGNAPKGASTLSKFQADIFFGKLGIYLKSQEMSALYNYLDCRGDQFSLERFIQLFQFNVPEEFIKELNEMFYFISGNQESVSVEKLLEKIRPENHPQISIMKNDPAIAEENLKYAIEFATGNKPEITKDEFIQLHKNIYWILPEENYELFKYKIPKLWGLSDLQEIDPLVKYN
jgi:hypothetical protein